MSLGSRAQTLYDRGELDVGIANALEEVVEGQGLLGVVAIDRSQDVELYGMIL